MDSFEHNARHQGDPEAGRLAGSADEPLTCVAFELDQQAFAVDVAEVREILDMQPITVLPNARGDLLGMIDVRGQGIAVIDLAARLGLGLGRINPPQSGRIIVLEPAFGHPSRPVGVIADKVLNVVAFPRDMIEAAPTAHVPWDGEAVLGVARVREALVIILNLAAIFATGRSDPFDFS